MTSENAQPQHPTGNIHGSALAIHPFVFFVATTSFTLEPPTTQTPERACVFAITKHGTVAIDLATVPPRTSFFHLPRDPRIGATIRPRNRGQKCVPTMCGDIFLAPKSGSRYGPQIGAT